LVQVNWTSCLSLLTQLHPPVFHSSIRLFFTDHSSPLNPREMYLDRSKFDWRRFNRQSYSTDDGSPLNPREMDLSWLRPHFEEQPAPPLEQMVAEQEASAEALLGGGARKLEAADVEAAAHHWRVMRLIFTGSFWSETY